MAKPIMKDHLRSAKKKRVVTVPICLDPELQEEYEQGSAELQIKEFLVTTAKEGGDPAGVVFAEAELAKAKEALAKTKAVVRENTVNFRFRAIGRLPFEKILNECPPTDEQKEKMKESGRMIDWDPEIFPMRIMEASLIEPELGPGELQEVLDEDTWTQTDFLALFNGALNANSTSNLVSLGKD